MSCLMEKLVKGGGAPVTEEGNIQKKKKYKRRRDKGKYKRRKPIDLKVKYANTTRRTSQTNSIKGQTWGDELSKSANWPAITENKTIRILNHNIKGISQLHNFYEFEMLLDYMENAQVDVAGFTEINLDLTKKDINFTLKKILKKFDRNAIASFSASRHTKKVNEIKKMGGTATIVRGNWSGRMIEMGQEKLGRWSYLTLTGKNNKKIKFITCYRVCKGSKETGPGSIRTQQEMDLLKEYGEIVDPRKRLLSDLEIHIQQEHSKGYHIILMGDLNEDVQNSKTIDKFLGATGLYNIHKEKHNKDLPNTHDRGKWCIDIMAISKTIPSEAIKKSGILPFYSTFPSDHRAMYVDINIEYLFTNAHADTTRHIYKRFSTSRVIRAEKYLFTLETKLEEAKVFKKIDKLENEIRDLIKRKGGDKGDIIKRCKNLFQQTTELMIASEKKLGRVHYSQGYVSSSKLKHLADKVFEIKKNKRRISVDEERNKTLIKQAEDQLKNAYKRLREGQNRADELRKSHHSELADKRSQQWNTTKAQAAIIIAASEESKELHSRHRQYIKPRKGGNIKYLMVPAPISEWQPAENDIVNSKCQTRIEDPTDIFNVLLRQNFRQLKKSVNSIFTNGLLREKVGWNAEKRYVEELLKGISKEKIIEEYNASGTITQYFIEACKRPITNTGDEVEPMEWKYGIEEYKNTFSKTSEDTACGPSGIHMSHWKIALERERLMRVHSFYIWAAFNLGFSYERWEVSWHCMLQKKDKPYAQKLRIIQLFEGDMNGALKYFMGRMLMRYATSKGIIDSEAYGSRLGKTSIEAIINLQLIFDNHRIWKKNIAMIFNDADGCFDRIPPNLADLALQRLGCPTSISNTHTLIQRNIKHHIKTAQGVSRGFIQFHPTSENRIEENSVSQLRGPIGGVGQGGGGSPIIWLGVLMIMLDAYRQMTEGITISNRITGMKIMYWIISYVDDNTILRNFTNGVSIQKILEDMKECLKIWNELLILTGGGLSLDKCKISVMYWKQDFWGRMKIESKDTTGITINTSQSNTAKEQEYTLERISALAAERILGIRLSMSGEMKQEYEYRKDQIEKLAHRLYTAPLSPSDAYTVYSTRYCPMIKYALPITTFSKTQLKNIQKRFIHLLLPKMGMNRNMPRAVIFGPRSKGGRELMDLRIVQPSLHITTNTGHMRRNDKAGKLLYTTMSDTQLELGIKTFFLKADPIKYNYCTKNTRWRYLWEFVHLHGIHLEVYNYWVPPDTAYSNDRVLMEQAVQDKFFNTEKTNKYLEVVNNCRMYVGAIFLSEITDQNGKIPLSILNGQVNRIKAKREKYPGIRKPPAAAWSIWKSFLCRNFLIKDYQVSPKIHRKPNFKPIYFKSTPTSIHSMVTKITLKDTIKSMPTEYLTILGEINIPEDDGRFIWESIVNGKVIGASDGSLITKNIRPQGGYSYSVQHYNNDSQRITGYGATPLSTNTSSLTSEKYGVLATLISIKSILQHYYDGRNLHSKICIVTDNAEVVKRGKERPTPMNISETMCAEYDLWVLLWELLDSIPTQVEIKWVKGHQNENANKELIHGPFLRDVQLNIEMDKLATEGVKLHAQKIYLRPLYHSTKMALYDEEGYQVNDIQQFLTEVINGPVIESYLDEKYGWDKNIRSMIDWEAIDRSLKRYTQFQYSKMIQIMYNWQNVGRQKEKIAEHEDGLCPAGCGEPETHCHYLHCRQEEMVKQQNQCREELEQKLVKLNTYSGITKAILQIMSEGIYNIHTTFTPNSNMDKYIQEAITEQDLIGQNALEKGFLSKQWIQAQDEWESTQQGKKKYSKRWNKEVVTLLQTYTYQLWKTRNEFIHGKHSEEFLQSTKTKLRQRVTELYKKEKFSLTSQERNIFNIPLSQQRKGSKLHLKAWIEKAEVIFQKYEARENKSIDTWFYPMPKEWKDKFK